MSVSRRGFIGLVASFTAITALRASERKDPHIVLIDEDGKEIAESNGFTDADLAPFRTAFSAKRISQHDLMVRYRPDSPVSVRYAEWRNVPKDLQWVTKRHDLSPLHMHRGDQLNLVMRLAITKSGPRDLP